MGLSYEDRLFIKNLYEQKRYGAKKLIREFPQKGWKKSTLNDFLRHFKETGAVERKHGIGRPRTIRTEENIAVVSELILSQEGKPKTHRSTRQISRRTGISCSSVFDIIHKDLGLKCFKRRRAQRLTEANCETRMIRAQDLLNFSASDVDFIFFTDEKVFTVEPPKNSQNDRLYAPNGTKKRDIDSDRLLRTRSTFTKSVMVSVAVSKLGFTDMFFVEPGVKINGSYYRDVLLAQQMLPAMRYIAGDFYVFQQDSAPAHRARETVEYLRAETPLFISPDLWPPNSPDLNPVDYKIWGFIQERVYRTAIQDTDDLKKRLVEVWSTMPQSVVDNAIDAWRDRLTACVQARGRNFEHYL